MPLVSWNIYSATHFFSAEEILMASMIALTDSVICQALIVCCSNLVFTADWDINSCEIHEACSSAIIVQLLGIML